MTDSTENNNDDLQVYVVGIYTKGLKVARDDFRKPGEELPEAHTWKANVLQAHINMKYIQTQEEYNMQKKHDEALERARLAKKKEKDERRAEAQKRRDEVAARNREADLALNGVKPVAQAPKENPVNNETVEPLPVTPIEPAPTGDKLDQIDAHGTLKDIAGSYNLSRGGGKVALRERIREHEKTLS